MYVDECVKVDFVLLGEKLHLILVLLEPVRVHDRGLEKAEVCEDVLYDDISPSLAVQPINDQHDVLGLEALDDRWEVLNGDLVILRG